MLSDNTLILIKCSLQKVYLPYYKYKHSSFLLLGLFWIDSFDYMVYPFPSFYSKLFESLYVNLFGEAGCFKPENYCLYIWTFILFILNITALYLCVFLHLIVYYSVCTFCSLFSFFKKNLILCLFGKVLLLYHSIPPTLFVWWLHIFFTCYPRYYKMNPWII